MKHLFHRKQKIKLFTWFRLSLLVVLLLAAGSLYTPYPAELVKALTEDGKPARKKKKKKVQTAAPTVVETPTVTPPPAAEDEEELEPEPWRPEGAFAMPSITSGC